MDMDTGMDIMARISLAFRYLIFFVSKGFFNLNILQNYSYNNVI